MTITIHNSEDFAKMRIAGKLAAEILDYITPFVEVGVTTDYLNDLCHKKISIPSLEMDIECELPLWWGELQLA